jgi:hypothetical protein
LLEDQKDAVVLSEDFKQVYYVVVFELLKNSNFAEGSLANL